MEDQPGRFPEIEDLSCIANSPHPLQPSSETVNGRRFRGVLGVVAALLSVALAPAIAQQASPQPVNEVTIQGSVLSPAGKPVADALVRLEQEGVPGAVEMKTNSAGEFAFSLLKTGRYSLSASKPGARSRNTAVAAIQPGEQKRVELVLEDAASPADSSATSPPSNAAMEFADKPNFTVAGVTDWTAAGGHGSDSSLRTSEALARETMTLKPEGAGHGAATSRAMPMRRAKRKASCARPLPTPLEVSRQTVSSVNSICTQADFLSPLVYSKLPTGSIPRIVTTSTSWRWR